MHIIADASGWLAMALLDNGGWMSDYENVQLMLTGYMGLEIMKQPGFKSWDLHVPAPAHIRADKKSLEILVELFKNTISPDFVSPDSGANLVTDMMVLSSLHQNLSEEEMDITLWENREKLLHGSPLSFRCTKGSWCSALVPDRGGEGERFR